ncbi:MAG: hypothetical protein H6834_08430 [Planctomycetes bacterium]|nr:hypothetical protein [Planctomycetota bacterium]
MRPAHLLTALVAAACPLAAQSPRDARFETWAEAYGTRDARLVRTLDALLPGDLLAKTSESEVRTILQRGGLAREGSEQEHAIAVFRRFQDVQRGFRYPLDDAGERYRPVPRSGSGAAPPPAPSAFSGLTEVEPNDALGLANPMTCADTMDGNISPAFDDDVFEITIQQATFFSAEVQPAGANPITDPTLTLFDRSGNVLAFNDDFNGLYPQIDVLLPPGTYFFLVEGFTFRTGTYRFQPRCSTPQSLDCSNGMIQGTLLPGRPQAFLLGVSQLDEVTVEVRHRNGTNAGYTARLFSQDGSVVILEDADATQPGEARFITGLSPGQYPLILENTTQTTGDFTLLMTCANQGVPSLNCGTSTVAIPDPDHYPALQIQPSILQLADITIADRALPDGASWHTEDSTGRTLASGNTTGGATTTFRSATGPGGLLRLENRAGGNVPTWRDTPAAIRWCRPAATGGYAGPTNETIATGPGFAFVDEHIDGLGRIHLRKVEECRFITSGSWDIGWYLDRVRVEINGQALLLENANVTTAGTVTFSSVTTSNTASATWTDDDVYLAVNFVDQNQAGQATLALELSFDASSLGITGSQIQSLRFEAEWYFAGNADVLTVAPPTVDDSSEEFDVLARRVEILRSGPMTWDPLFDVAGGASTSPTGSNLVDVTASCSAFPMGPELSAEDAAQGNVASPVDQVAHLFRVRSPITATFRTDNGSSMGIPQRWRDDVYANDWSLPSAQYPGPIAESSTAAWPADIVGPGGLVQVRLLKKACWADSTWDDAHYYDHVALTIDDGQGPLTHVPSQWSLTGDVSKFAATGILFTNDISDLANDDDVYARSFWDDFDAISRGPDSTYADVFTFDVSSQLAAGSGQLVQSLGLVMEVYLSGDGFFAIPNVVDSSEEQYLLSLDVEILDWNTMTWLDLSSQAIIDAQRYTAPSNCASTTFLDPYLRVFRTSPFVLVQTDDDSVTTGNGRDAEVRVRVGDPASGVEAIAVVVSASPFASPTETMGPYGLFTEAPFGFAGDAPFEISLGGTLVIRLRGEPGRFGAAFHTYRVWTQPIALGVPFSGFLTLDPTALVLITPNGLISASSILEATVSIPNTPALVGNPVWSQAIIAQPGFTMLDFTNEDSVVVR